MFLKHVQGTSKISGLHCIPAKHHQDDSYYSCSESTRKSRLWSTDPAKENEVTNTYGQGFAGPGQACSALPSLSYLEVKEGTYVQKKQALYYCAPSLGNANTTRQICEGLLPPRDVITKCEVTEITSQSSPQPGRS